MLWRNDPRVHQWAEAYMAEARRLNARAIDAQYASQQADTKKEDAKKQQREDKENKKAPKVEVASQHTVASELPKLPWIALVDAYPFCCACEKWVHGTQLHGDESCRDGWSNLHRSRMKYYEQDKDFRTHVHEMVVAKTMLPWIALVDTYPFCCACEKWVQGTQLHGDESCRDGWSNLHRSRMEYYKQDKDFRTHVHEMVVAKTMKLDAAETASQMGSTTTSESCTMNRENLQAQKAQEKHRLDCEPKTAEERKQRVEELRWQREKSKLLTPESGVLTATYKSSDKNWYVKLQEPGKDDEWIVVQDSYYCKWCDKHLNDSTLESHVLGKAHKKNAEWKQAQGTSSCSTREDLDYSEDWFKHVDDEWGGHIRCLACDKRVDVVHVQTASHISRVTAWKERKTLNVQPIEEWLMYVFWFPDCTEECDMGVKCLLCDKFCQGLHLHGDDPEKASKEHKKRLNNYHDFVDDVRRRRADNIRGDKTGLIQKICERQTCALRGPSGHRPAPKLSDTKSQALRSNKQKRADSPVVQNQKPQGRRNLAPMRQTCYAPPCRPQQLRPVTPPNEPHPVVLPNNSVSHDESPHESLPNVPSSKPALKVARSQFELTKNDDDPVVLPNNSVSHDASLHESLPNVPSSNPAPKVARSQFEDNGAMHNVELKRRYKSYGSILEDARKRGHAGCRVTTAYDALEMMNGQVEGGYLPLRLGEVVILCNGSITAGEKHNRFKTYGSCKNIEGVIGWCPMECMEIIPE